MNSSQTNAAKGQTRKNLPSLVFALTLALAPLLPAAGAAAAEKGGYSGPGGAAAGGGYSGPGPAPMTVEQAKALGDDARVTLKGNIIQSLGGKHYVFKDATGTINVEIGDRRWRGQNIGPQDLVEIQGELDKEWSGVEIEVKRITRR